MNLKRFFLLLMLGSAALQAEPYIAVRTGFKCSQCHVNQTGGGKRTEYGFVYSQYKLLMKSALTEYQAFSFDPKLNASVSTGANFRIVQSRSLDYKWNPTPAQDSAGLDTVDLRSRDNSDIKEGNLYLQLDLVRNFFTLYLDQTMSPSTASREMWAMVRLPSRSYFKFGKMLLPYGFRLMDDEAFVRKVTNYTYNNSGVGYEAGLEPGPLSLVVNVTSTQLSSVGSLVFNNFPIVRTFRIGGSYGTDIRKTKRSWNNTKGMFAGFSLGMFTVLGEHDLIRADSVNKEADFMEVNFLPMQGLNFKATYEYLWPDKVVPKANSGDRRLVFGVESFITQFLQLGLYYRQNDGPPQIGNNNQDEISGRFHAFF